LVGKPEQKRLLERFSCRRDNNNNNNNNNKVDKLYGGGVSG
jgi:hypothetical protein